MFHQHVQAMVGAAQVYGYTDTFSDGEGAQLTVHKRCLFAHLHCSLGAVRHDRENDSMDAREPAVQQKRVEENLFQLCTTSFMASFLQMKAWQTYSSLFL